MHGYIKRPTGPVVVYVDRMKWFAGAPDCRRWFGPFGTLNDLWDAVDRGEAD